MSFLTPVWNYVDSLVHPSVQHDALTAARHRAFIAPRLFGSFAALASFPVYLAVRGVPTLLEVGVFAWLILPIFSAYFLSRTGQYERAHMLSSLSLAALMTAVIWCTGGIESSAAVWLILVPLEAALSASRRIVVQASICVLAAIGALLLFEIIGFLPPVSMVASKHGAFAALGIVSAIFYATGIALAIEWLMRMGFGLLHAEEDRRHFLEKNMTDVVMLHSREGMTLFVSPNAEQLLGVPNHKLAGFGLFERLHVADRPAYLNALSDTVLKGKASSIECRIRCGGDSDTKSGQYNWVEMRCQPFHGPKTEKREEAVVVLRDISQQKAQERAIEIAGSETERANAVKSRFLASMSHELRTPLNAIIGFSEMIMNDTLPIDEARKDEYVKLINDSGRHLLSVVNGILEMSRIEAGNFEISPETFSTAEAIANCCELFTLKAHEGGVTIIKQISKDLPDLFADRRAFNQILINLISNALKFTPRAGQIMVSARPENENLVFAVEDTGIGIDEGDLPRIGEAFFQARNSDSDRREGTGLGLSIVKGLVRLHDGNIDVWSRVGKGTRVTVCLPIKSNVDSAGKSADGRIQKLIPVSNIRVKKSA